MPAKRNSKKSKNPKTTRRRNKRASQRPIPASRRTARTFERRARSRRFYFLLALGPASRRVGVVTLAGDVEDIERRVGEERGRIEAEYREVLKSSVAFEKKIRNRWRAKNRRKNARIAELEARVAELESELEGQEPI